MRNARLRHWAMADSGITRDEGCRSRRCGFGSCTGPVKEASTRLRRPSIISDDQIRLDGARRGAVVAFRGVFKHAWPTRGQSQRSPPQRRTHRNSHLSPTPSPRLAAFMLGPCPFASFWDQIRFCHFCVGTEPPRGSLKVSS